MLIGGCSPEPGKIVVPDNGIPDFPGMADAGADGMLHCPPVGIPESPGDIRVNLFGKTLGILLPIAKDRRDQMFVPCAVHGKIQLTQHGADFLFLIRQFRFKGDDHGKTSLLA